MKGLQQMVFNQQGAVEAFQVFLSKNTSFNAEPKVKSVRMTKSCRFIVDIAQPEAQPAKALSEQPPSKRQVVGSNPTVHTTLS